MEITEAVPLPKKVLHVLNSASGGAALSTYGLIEEFAKRGIASCAVCHELGTSEGRDQLLELVGGNAIFTPLYWGNRKSRAATWKRPLLEAYQWWKTGFVQKSTRAVAEFAKQQAVDVIHTNNVLTPEGGRAGVQLGIPHVCHVRELIGPGTPYPMPGQGRTFGLYLAKHCARLVANSEITASKFRDWLPAPSILEVVPNGIDLRSFARLQPRAPGKKIIVAMVGNLTCRWKKHNLVVETAALVPRELPIEWRFYGADPSDAGQKRGDPYLDHIHDRIAKANLSDRVRLMGFVPDPAAVMSEIDILIHTADQESFGRIIVEAMAAGLPVVGVRGGGVGEIVVHEETGLLAAIDDVHGLAKHIERLAGDSELRRRMGDADACEPRHATRSTLARAASSRFMKTCFASRRTSDDSDCSTTLALMKFSICIPNFNYAQYLGETISSVLAQSHPVFEVVIADNASTDGSVDVAHGFKDSRIKLRVNACNVGFAGNLDRCCRMAMGDRMILLSSDDLMKPDHLETYSRLAQAIGDGVEQDVFTASVENIDSTGRHLKVLGLPARNVWRESDRFPDLDAVAGAPVYRVAGGELLGRCLLAMQNPFHFATTCYARALYERVEGYGGERMLNPDKWFHWKLLGVARYAYFVARPLSCYRTHNSNQASLESASGALKFLLDEYASTFQVSPQALATAGLNRDAVERAFVHFDIVGSAIRELAAGNSAQSRRILALGDAAYPKHMRGNAKVVATRALARSGFAGRMVAKKLMQHYSTSSGA